MLKDSASTRNFKPTVFFYFLFDNLGADINTSPPLGSNSLERENMLLLPDVCYTSSV